MSDIVSVQCTKYRWEPNELSDTKKKVWGEHEKKGVRNRFENAPYQNEALKRSIRSARS